MEIIELFDEDNNPQEFYLLDTFGINEDNYVVLEAIHEDEYYILKTREKDGELLIYDIDNEDEFNEALEVYEELLEDIDGENYES